MKTINIEEIEKYFDQYEKKNVDFKDEYYTFKYASWVQDAFIAGFKKAIKISNKLEESHKIVIIDFSKENISQYTIKDMKKAFEAGKDYVREPNHNENFDEFIEQLNKENDKKI